MSRMSHVEIDAALATMPGWERDGDTIRKEFRRKGFTGAAAFVQRMVEPANAADHHPDLEIHYHRVVVVLSTHDEGGITEKDLTLARTIDALAVA
jgi:4a-hydroxytetrahydrobiopterin dehydratase